MVIICYETEWGKGFSPGPSDHPTALTPHQREVPHSPSGMSMKRTTGTSRLPPSVEENT